MRSFRVQHLSRFVKALLDGEAELGRGLFAEFRDRCAIVLTRSMRAARRWTEKQRRQYLKNASLVLLTRAPAGEKRDRTRSPAFYEGVYDYLTGMGVAEV
jgi:hypothetical protein